MKQKKTIRLFALFLTLLLVVTALPLSVFASEQKAVPKEENKSAEPEPVIVESLQTPSAEDNLADETPYSERTIADQTGEESFSAKKEQTPDRFAQFSDGVYSIRRMGTNYYLGTESRYTSAPLFQWQIPYVPDNVELRGYLFKIVYRPATDDYVIRSMQNNAFFLYHNVADHTIKIGPVNVNGAPATDANLPEQYAWKIGIAQNYYANRVWNTYNGQDYFLRSPQSGNGVNTVLTTSPQDTGTMWDFCAYMGEPLRGVQGWNVVQRMIQGEQIQFGFVMYDDRPGVNGPVTYSVSNTSGGPTSVAGIAPATGLCTAFLVGTFRLRVTYSSAPYIWWYTINVEQSHVGQFRLKNAKYDLYAEAKNIPPQNSGIIESKESNGSNTQRWQIVYLGNGYYKIVSVADTSFVLTIHPGGIYNSGAAVILDTFFSSNDNQKWHFIPTSSGRYIIQAKSAESDPDGKFLALDLSGDLRFVQQRIWIDNSSYRDEWKLIP